MKKLLPLLLLLLISTSAVAQTSKEADKTLIKELIINSFQDIFSNLDPESLGKYYTADFLLLENGEVWDNEMITDYMNRLKKRESRLERINSFDFIEIKIRDGMAWVAYHNTATFEKEGEIVGEMNWLESATAVKTKNGWRLQMLHSPVVEEE